MYKSPSIQAIGIAVPPHQIFQEKHYSILESANGLNRAEQLQLRKIYSRSGIHSRYSVLPEFAHADQKENVLFHPSNLYPALAVSERMKLYDEFSLELSVEAVKKCMMDLPDLQLSAITHLVTFSCTGMSAPGLDIQLVNTLGLNSNIERTCINFMGCYAGINALKFAKHISRSEPDAVVLLVGVELCTLHYQKNDKSDQMIANALFADGAAASIVSTRNLNKSPNSSSLALDIFYSEFEYSGKDEMVWTIGDFGFNLKLSIFVPDLIEKNIFSLTEKLFVKAGINREEIDFYAIHPGGMKILEACENALGIDKSKNQISYQVLNDYGNMSSVTIFFVLKSYLEKFTSEDKGKKVLACAFGPGLTMESLIAEVC
ncbi:type III polyketide synthase [soil metagenome]